MSTRNNQESPEPEPTVNVSPRPEGSVNNHEDTNNQESTVNQPNSPSQQVQDEYAGYPEVAIPFAARRHRTR